MNRKNPQLARCPHCESVFEISEQELELAYGAVRCGECMKIFNAHFHKLDLPEQEQEDSEPAERQDPIPTLHDHYQQPRPDSLSESQPSAPEATTSAADEELQIEYQEPDLDDQELPFDPPSATEEARLDEDYDATEEKLLDEELRAFEAELTTALIDPAASETDDSDRFPALTPDDFNDQDGKELEPEITPDATTDSELATEARPQASKKKPVTKKASFQAADLQDLARNKWVLGASGLLVAVLVAAALFFTLAPKPPQDLVTRDIRIAPSIQTTKMEVHFQLYNRSSEPLALPDFRVELLNLSGQVIASQTIAATELNQAPSQLAGGDEVNLSLEVDRPATFVQNARVFPLTTR